MSGVRWTVLGCIAFIGAILAAFVYNVTADRAPQLTDEQVRELGGFVLPRPRDLAPFALTDESGQPFDNDALRGRWSLLFFGYTFCPDICPATMSVLGKTVPQLRTKLVGTELQVVMVSVDPDRDDPAKLKQYVEYFGEDFRGVTGTRDALAAFGIQLNATFAKVPAEVPGGYLVDHTGNIVLINPRGHYHGFLRMPHDAERIAKVLPALIARY